MKKLFKNRTFNVLLLMLFIISNIHAQTANQDTVKNKEDFSDDWAALSHYAKENAALPPPKEGEQCVVFLGSSIFERWKDTDPDFFSNQAYIDRGISGQIAPQLLIRFRQDVIDLQPKAVIILAGSNDIAANKGHITYERIMDNIQSMAELATLHGIKVILCKYLPIYDYPWRKGLQPAEKIIALNKLIQAYATANNFTILDYFTPLVDERNGQKAELTIDGVHPNVAGYKVMEKVTEEAIQEALQ
jgi:lysophospholipase L1-like esterase